MHRLTPISALLLLSLLLASCAGSKTVLERTTRGPMAEEVFIERSYLVNGRGPTFDEKRQWQDEMDAKVFKYLREHPEIEQTTRYTPFRFWRQVTNESTPDEVRVLLGDPEEQTIDPALMRALAERHWSGVQQKAKEAWVYSSVGWVLYFDDKGVVEMVRRVSAFAPTEQ